MKGVPSEEVLQQGDGETERGWTALSREEGGKQGTWRGLTKLKYV